VSVIVSNTERLDDASLLGADKWLGRSASSATAGSGASLVASAATPRPAFERAGVAFTDDNGVSFKGKPARGR
jgi:hypothetical protein